MYHSVFHQKKPFESVILNLNLNSNSNSYKIYIYIVEILLVMHFKS